MKHRALIAALALPAAALLGLTGYKAVKRNTGTEVVVPITGYDPRDLLSGHYLIYRLDVDHGVICEVEPPDPVFLCVEQHSGFRAYRIAGLDFASDSCAAVLRGRCDGARFVAGIERFYIPEEHSVRLDGLVRGWGDERVQAGLAVAVDRHGTGTIRELLIDGVPWRDYLAAHQ